MDKIRYTNSDTNFCAYLMYLGYAVVDTKVTKKDNGKPMVTFMFEGTQFEFNKVHRDYKFDEITINLSRYIELKDETYKMVKSLLTTYFTTLSQEK